MVKERTTEDRAALQAAKVATGVAKGVKGKVSDARTVTRFRRPITKRTPKTPKLTKWPREDSKKDVFRLVKSPLVTEASLRKVEEDNTLVFLCDPLATKPEIRRIVSQRFNVKVKKVNTLIRPDGVKKAFVRLDKGYDALDVANKMGII